MRVLILHRLFALTLALVSVGSLATSQGTTIGFDEVFALARDRNRALEELIPGTVEFYFYSCLHAQNEGQLEEAKQALRDWKSKHGEVGQYQAMELRLALLSYDDAPQETIDFLIRELGLRFNHQREQLGTSPNFPVQLDPALISYQTLLKRAFARGTHAIGEFQDRALADLVGRSLNDTHLRDLLARLQRPDLPGLPALIVRDLARKNGPRFGSLKIHKRLLLEQLDECARLRPELLEDHEFIAAYLRRLAPGADEDLTLPIVRHEHLVRLESFVRRLSPAFNSLLAHVLYRRLQHDFERANPNLDRFLTYLRLPRATSYGDRDYLRGKHTANLGQAYHTGYDPIRDDEALVRTYLAHFIGEGSSLEQFVGPLHRRYVERIFAETKILAGVGDMERWYTLLDDPGYYERLKDRVELEFPATQDRRFAIDETVVLELDVKNVETLIVKVFEIDTLGFYESQAGGVLRELDATIDLDGLVASQELTFTYDSPALRRVRRQFEFEEFNRPGVWVIDFIGGGLSSRAIVRKGGLSVLERAGAAGHNFQVIDGTNQVVTDASIHFAGREYTADKRGLLSIPYSTEPGQRQIILRQGDFAVLSSFTHHAERYQLEAGIHVERETLLAGETAEFVLRPRLSINQNVVPLSILKDVRLEITSLDLNGVATTQTIRDVELSADRATLHAIRVPPRTARLQVSLQGEARNLTRGEDVTLRTPAKSFSINQIDLTAELFTGLMTRTPDGYALDLRGKNGELITDHAVTVNLHHRDFRSPVYAHLKSDENGRVHLGELRDITDVQVSGIGSGTGNWNLRELSHSGLPSALFGVSGTTLRLVHEGDASRMGRSVASLLELRGNSPAIDRSDKLAIAGGFLELRDLASGNYELALHESDLRIPVHVTRGQRRSGWGLGAARRLELSDETPLQIESAEIVGDELVVTLLNFGKTTRVHFSATRYLPGFDTHSDLALPPLRGLREQHFSRSDSLLASGREISEEYRYILERRLARIFPGNMLTRLGLLLNPWAIDESTDTRLGSQSGASGPYGGKAMGALRSQESPASTAAIGATMNPMIYANLDFLPGPAPVIWNQFPDEAGTVRIPLSALGDNHLVRVAAVDRGVTLSRTVVREETKLVPRDRRLPGSLDVERHLTEQRRIEFIRAGESVALGDLAFSGLRTLDSLESVFQLLLTLNGNSELAKFEFLVNWPDLNEKEKFDRYSEFASHEVHVFLHKKDPEFFESVIRPYLANKAEKSFIDNWLLEEDLSAYLEPWAFERLNIVERVLLLRSLNESAARHVRELVELYPPDTFALGRYFETVLATGGLDSKDGLAAQLGELKKEARARKSLADGPRGPSGPGGTGDQGFFTGEGERSEAEGLAMPAEEMLDALGYMGEDDDEAELGLRENVRQFFRDVSDTQELAESNYWHVPFAHMTANLISPTPFWLDFAETAADAPFISSRFPLASRNTTEVLLALAFLDLPFEAGEHSLEDVDKVTTLEAGSSLFLARKEIADAIVNESAPTILVGQDFLRGDDRTILENGVYRDRFVTDEFLRRVVYVCRVVVTNPSSTPLNVDVLLQVPKGAIPVQSGFETRGVPISLSAYGSRAIEYSFYFPEAGEFSHYPVHVGRDGELLGFADAQSLSVLEKPSTIDTTSWLHVSQRADTETVMQFLGAANLNQLELHRIAWRMRDRATFERVIELLRNRFSFDDTLWSYGLHHRDEGVVREYLERRADLVQRCGPVLSSPLLTIIPEERGLYEHLEYAPLIHGRAHRFGSERQILDRDVAQQYLAYMRVLAFVPKLDDDRRMQVTYYLALQDRVEEALEMFASVDVSQLETRIQHDYMRAYLGFYTGDLADAREVASAYADFPVTRWRSRFRDVIVQLDEAEGGDSAGSSDPDSREQNQGVLASTEPSLEIEVEARRVRLAHANIDSCVVSYRKMDIELLFSTNPFLKAGSSSFAFIKPNRTDAIELDRSGSEHEFALPEEFHSSNVLVEVRAGGLVRRQAYYANDLTVQGIENYGQIKVREASSGRALPATYVKVYARLANGQTRFHKDGYTDIRGRFDYVSLSGMDNAEIQRFAVLVLTEDDGAVVREFAPPTR